MTELKEKPTTQSSSPLNMLFNVASTQEQAIFNQKAEESNIIHAAPNITAARANNSNSNDFQTTEPPSKPTTNIINTSVSNSNSNDLQTIASPGEPAINVTNASTNNASKSYSQPNKMPISSTNSSAAKSCAVSPTASDQSKAAMCSKTVTRSKNATQNKTATQIASIEISQIMPNPNQPRKSFSEPAILKLADSIRQFGIIQPLTVRKLGHVYELVAGERRLRAAKELGWKHVPCIITDIAEEKSAEISIIENLIREDLNIFEQAMAIEALIDTYSLTQEQIAEKLSASQSYIANKLRLLRFSQEEREIILANQLTERHARALLRISDQNVRQSFLAKIIRTQLNVTSTEVLIGEYLANNNNQEKSQTTPPQKTLSSLYNSIKRVIDGIKETDLGIKYQKFVGDTHTEIVIKLPNAFLDSNEEL